MNERLDKKHRRKFKEDCYDFLRGKIFGNNHFNQAAMKSDIFVKTDNKIPHEKVIDGVDHPKKSIFELVPVNSSEKNSPMCLNDAKKPTAKTNQINQNDIPGDEYISEGTPTNFVEIPKSFNSKKM